MERRKLGKNGPEVGVIGLGTEHLERSVETMDAVLRAAVEAGSDYVDLLYVETDYWETYGSLYRKYRDKLILAAMAKEREASGGRRRWNNCAATRNRGA